MGINYQTSTASPDSHHLTIQGPFLQASEPWPWHLSPRKAREPTPTTTASGSAPALGGANIRRLQVGGLLASLGLGMSGSMFFFPGKNPSAGSQQKTKEKKTWK